MSSGSSENEAARPSPLQNGNEKVAEFASYVWRPTRLDTDFQMLSSKEKKARIFTRNVTGILNKLTSRNFEILAEKIKTVTEDRTEDRLQELADLILQKAVGDPLYCKWYAAICNVIRDRTIPDNNSTAVKTFWTVLVTLCQRQLKYDRMKKRGVKIINSVETEKDEKLIRGAEYEECKKNSVGLYRFIGELYKLQMLCSYYTKQFFHKLLNDKKEESLECLCAFLATVGKDLEQKLSANDLEPFLGLVLVEMETKPFLSLSSKTLLLKSAETLQLNNWSPRLATELSETIGQLDVELKKKELEIILRNIAPCTSEGSRSEWQTVRSKRKRRKTTRKANKNKLNGAVKLLNKADLDRAVGNIFDEFVCLNDIQEMQLRFQEQFHPKQYEEAIISVILNVTENKPKSGDECGIFVAHLYKEMYRGSSVLLNLLNAVIVGVEEMELDVPKAWEYLGLIISSLISEECVRFYELWTKFSGSKFLAYVQNKPSVKREQNCQSILKKLLTDYVVNESLFNDVESWIQDNIANTEDLKFISTFAKIINEICKEEMEKNEEEPNFKEPLKALKSLRRFFQHYIIDKRQKMQFLKAIVEHNEKASYPDGLLPKIYESLYDLNLIAGSIFIECRNAADIAKETSPAVLYGFYECLCKIYASI